MREIHGILFYSQGDVLASGIRSQINSLSGRILPQSGSHPSTPTMEWPFTADLYYPDYDLFYDHGLLDGIIDGTLAFEEETRQEYVPPPAVTSTLDPPTTQPEQPSTGPTRSSPGE